MQTNEKLRLVAINAAAHAYSPYSKVHVGSAVLMSDGSVYAGCNVENASFGGTVCAERVAIFKAISENKRSIEKVYVYTTEGWPPCGLCRQVISEFAAPNAEVIMGNAVGGETIMKFKDLMPLSFTPEHLKV